MADSQSSGAAEMVLNGDGIGSMSEAYRALTFRLDPLIALIGIFLSFYTGREIWMRRHCGVNFLVAIGYHVLSLVIGFTTPPTQRNSYARIHHHVASWSPGFESFVSQLEVAYLVVAVMFYLVPLPQIIEAVVRWKAAYFRRWRRREISRAITKWGVSRTVAEFIVDNYGPFPDSLLEEVYRDSGSPVNPLVILHAAPNDLPSSLSPSPPSSTSHQSPQHSNSTEPFRVINSAEMNAISAQSEHMRSPWEFWVKKRDQLLVTYCKDRGKSLLEFLASKKAKRDEGPEDIV